ncbi:MAG: menaquinone biosynthesis protein [Desulforegulaceae bacterium]|nr:menaquinone biosynthesis protein [Desulforegulaceae bacterium]
MSNLIKLGKFSYINVAPVYYNLEKYLPQNFCIIKEGPPAKLNLALEEENLDLSPVSAFAYAVNHEKWQLIPDISIGCTKKVISVLLAADLKFEELDNKKILLTNESASGASLLKILFYEKNIYPKFYSGDIHKLDKKEYDAVLVIGDNALLIDWEKKFKNVYDLGQSWFEFTNLPFVFGVWAVSKKSYLKNKIKINQIKDILHENKKRNLDFSDEMSAISANKKNTSKEFMANYFKTIEYDLSEQKIKGLKLFYSLLFKHKFIKNKVILEFVKG